MRTLISTGSPFEKTAGYSRAVVQGDWCFVSGTTGQGLDDLRARLAEAAAARWRRVRTTLPYHAGALVQRIRTRGALRRADYDETGIRIEADVPPDLAAEIETYIRTS